MQPLFQLPWARQHEGLQPPEGVPRAAACCIVMHSVQKALTKTIEAKQPGRWPATRGIRVCSCTTPRHWRAASRQTRRCCRCRSCLQSVGEEGEVEVPGLLSWESLQIPEVRPWTGLDRSKGSWLSPWHCRAQLSKASIHTMTNSLR